MTAHAASPSATPSSPRPILQPHIPTGVTTSTTDISASRIPIDNHSFKPDLDPTEWKPQAVRSGRPAANRYDSEAFRYLSSFHRAINKSNDFGNAKCDVAQGYGVANTAPSTPSLGNTPTTSASSWSMSTSNGYVRDDYNTRPLMPRHNRWHSSSGIDLVTPHIPPPTDAFVKKDIVLDGHKKGELGAFFGGLA